MHSIEIQTENNDNNNINKMQKIEKKLFDSINSRKEQKMEVNHLRTAIGRQEQEIKNLISDKRDLENQIMKRQKVHPNKHGPSNSFSHF